MPGSTLQQLLIRSASPLALPLLPLLYLQERRVRRRTPLLPLLPETRAELVVIALGVNDVLRPRGPRRWARDLAVLIASLRERPGPVPVVLAPVPQMHLLPGLPEPLRGVLGMRAPALDSASSCLARRLPAVAHVRLHFEGPAEAYFCQDRFHPSVRGYASWGEQLAEAALPLLKARDARQVTASSGSGVRTPPGIRCFSRSG